MRINILSVGIIMVIILFGGIGSTMAMDIWSTTSSKTPIKFKDGYAAGSYNPTDIRGSYTFSDIARLFKIDLHVLYQAFNLPEDTDGTKIKSKDLEMMYETSSVDIGNESIQIFVALYKNLPIELGETYIPKKAATLILQKNRQLTARQRTYLNTHTIDLSKVKKTKGTSSQVADESENVVNGSATFQKAMDAGVTKKQIETIINADMPPSNQTIKDYCIENGLSFPTIKDQLNKLID